MKYKVTLEYVVEADTEDEAMDAIFQELANCSFDATPFSFNVALYSNGNGNSLNN